MRISPISILLDKDLVFDKKFYFIGGNETTLMEKINSTITNSFEEQKNTSIKKIDTIDNFVEETGLFEDEIIYLVKNCKGLDEKNLKKVKDMNSKFIFFQENSQKTKKFKDFFLKDPDSYLIDCYELDKE